MRGEDRIKKLVLRSSDDLLTVIYEEARRTKGGGRPSWQRVVRSARAQGIFTEAQARRFLRLVSHEQPGSASGDAR